MPPPIPFGDISGTSPSRLAQVSIFPSASTAAGTATANRDLIASKISGVVATGKPARIGIYTPGTYLVAGGSTGYYSTGKGCIVLSALPAGSIFEIGPGVTLKLPDSSMTGTTLWYDMFIGDAAGLDVTLLVGGTVDMNSTNQPGWSAGYAQVDGSTGARFTCTVGTFSRIKIECYGSGQFRNTFASPVIAYGVASTATFGGTVLFKNLRAYNAGEGFECDVCDFFWADGCEFKFTDNLNGDVFEGVNCKEAWFTNCKAYHENGTQSPLGGEMDVGGTTVARIVNCSVSDTPQGITARTTNLPGLGTRKCEYISVHGFKARNIQYTAIEFPDGLGDWHGVDVESSITGFFFVRTASITGVKHRLYGCRSSAASVVRGLVNIELHGCELSSATGTALALERSTTYTGTPTVLINGGSLTGTGAYGLLVNSGNIGAYAPTVRTVNSPTISGGAGTVFKTGTGATLSGVQLDTAILEANTIGVPGLLYSVDVNLANVTGTTIGTPPSGMRAQVTGVYLVVKSATTPSGAITASAGTAAGSYIDLCPSQSFTPATVGQRIPLTISSTAAQPTDIFAFNVTTALASGSCTATLEVEGRFVGVP